MMRKEIKVSIIIPVYNGEKYLRETINSCTNQTIIDNIEIIVIDDASKDSSLEIIKDFEKIKLITNHKNKGIAKNVNRGIDIAKGKYLMFLGHDDKLEPNHIEIMISKFDNNTSLVFCDSFLIDSNSNIIKDSNVLPNIEEKAANPIFNLVLTNFINSCGLLFRRDYALKVGKWEIDNDFMNFGEWKFWIKLAGIGNLKYCNETKSYYRRHETNITNSFRGDLTPLKLFNYYTSCRKLGLNSEMLNSFQKISLSIFMINLALKYKIKTFLHEYIK